MTKRPWTLMDTLRAAIALPDPADYDLRTRPKALIPNDEPQPETPEPKVPATPDKAVGSGRVQPRKHTPDDLFRSALGL